MFGQPASFLLMPLYKALVWLLERTHAAPEVCLCHMLVGHALSRALWRLPKLVRDFGGRCQSHATRPSRLTHDLLYGDIHSAQRHIRCMVTCNEQQLAQSPTLSWRLPALVLWWAIIGAKSAADPPCHANQFHWVMKTCAPTIIEIGELQRLTAAAGCMNDDDLQGLLGAGHAQMEGLAPVWVRSALLPTRAGWLRARLHRPAARAPGKPL